MTESQYQFWPKPKANFLASTKTNTTPKEVICLLPTPKPNFGLKTMALLEALKTLRTDIINPPTNKVFLTDYKSLLETSRDSQINYV
jgi:hypothetical protein